MRRIKRRTGGAIINSNSYMATRRAAVFAVLFVCLCVTAHSQQIRDGEFIELRRDSVRTGIFHAITVNLDTLELWASSQRIIDSLITARATAAVDYLPYYMYGVLPNNTSDSVNLQIGVNGVYEAALPNFAMKAFNFALLSTNGTGLISTWRTDLPSLTGDDSTFIVRVSRNDAMTPKCAATIYKMPITAGADINNKTAGTFYDMVRFSDLILPVGANRFFTFNMMMRRQ